MSDLVEQHNPTPIEERQAIQIGAASTATTATRTSSTTNQHSSDFGFIPNFHYNTKSLKIPISRTWNLPFDIHVDDSGGDNNKKFIIRINDIGKTDPKLELMDDDELISFQPFDKEI